MNSDNNLRHYTSRGYTIDRVLDHDEIISFVTEHLRIKNFVTISFIIITLIGVAFTLGFSIINFNDLSYSGILFGFLIGVLIIVPLIPFHEGLHGVGYKICGASKISFGVNWKRMYFTASANQFVASYHQFLFIGLLPFFVINIIGVATIVLSSPLIQFAAAVCLTFHNIMCAGDFGILSYFYSKRELKPKTFDDVPNSRSYFLIKVDN